VFAPRNWARLYSPTYGRSDLVAEWFDNHLFDKATYHDLTAVRGPGVIINATDITRGATFSFIPDQFDLICSDLGSMPISRAVVASAAVPVLFSPISLRNYAGSCGYQTPAWMTAAIEAAPDDSRRQQRARLMASYNDSANRPYIHLVDGGIADNLGLRAILDDVISAGSIRQAFARQRLESTTHVLFVVVNAQAGLNADWDKVESGPSTTAIIDSATTVQINRYNFETVELLRSSFVQWANDLRDARCAARREPEPVAQNSTPCEDVHLHMVEVSFETVADTKQQQYLKSLPTSFNLPPRAVDALRDTARSLLRDSPEFHRFLSEFQQK
jgi:NTE family protein